MRDIWTLKLYELFSQIEFWHRLKLPKAVICVEELGQRFGSYDPLTRTISICEKLIADHPWQVVEEVLRHEMAHLIAFELLGYDPSGEGPHGPTFQQAAKMVGLSGWAARASGELDQGKVPDWRRVETTTTEDRLLAKAEKLLALAESGTENEAVVAMKTVKELYSKYNLDRIGERKITDMVVLVICRKRKRLESTESLICSILQQHYFVRTICGKQFDAKDMTDYQAIEVIGTRENVLMAEYVSNFLWTKIDQLWRDYKGQTGKKGYAKRAYQLGLLSGFLQKLDQLDNDSTSRRAGASASDRPAGHSLVLVRQAQTELDRFLRYRHPRTASRSYSTRFRDSEAFSAGTKDGRNITVSRPVSESQGSRGCLLT